MQTVYPETVTGTVRIKVEAINAEQKLVHLTLDLLNPEGEVLFANLVPIANKGLGIGESVSFGKVTLRLVYS